VCYKKTDYLIEIMFYVPPNTKCVILRTFCPANLFSSEKLKYNKSKHASITKHNKHYYNALKTRARYGYLLPVAWNKKGPILERVNR